MGTAGKEPPTEEVRSDEEGERQVVTPNNSPPPSPVSTKCKLVHVDGMANSGSDPPGARGNDPPGATPPSGATEGEVELPQEQETTTPEPTSRAINLDAELPEGWKPNSYSVICGRGKDCFESEGNKRFRGIINRFLNEYTAAPGKSEKSKIVTKAMNIIRDASPVGAFVKFENGKWHEVNLRYAREKVGAWFRDCLHHRYKSSSKAKHARKMAKRVSYDNLVAPDAVFSFPKNFADQIKAHERTTKKSKKKKQRGTDPFGQQQFYDIDDLALIPFDQVDC